MMFELNLKKVATENEWHLGVEGVEWNVQQAKGDGESLIGRDLLEHDDTPPPPPPIALIAESIFDFRNL